MKDTIETKGTNFWLWLDNGEGGNLSRFEISQYEKTTAGIVLPIETMKEEIERYNAIIDGVFTYKYTQYVLWKSTTYGCNVITPIAINQPQCVRTYITGALSVNH